MWSPRWSCAPVLGRCVCFLDEYHFWTPHSIFSVAFFGSSAGTGQQGWKDRGDVIEESRSVGASSKYQLSSLKPGPLPCLLPHQTNRCASISFLSFAGIRSSFFPSQVRLSDVHSACGLLLKSTMHHLLLSSFPASAPCAGWCRRRSSAAPAAASTPVWCLCFLLVSNAMLDGITDCGVKCQKAHWVQSHREACSLEFSVLKAV
jgi:hypothetical protein